jgi:hypothetical protein
MKRELLTESEAGSDFITSASTNKDEGVKSWPWKRPQAQHQNIGTTDAKFHVAGVLYHTSKQVATSEFVPVSSALRPL